MSCSKLSKIESKTHYEITAQTTAKFEYVE